MQQPTIQQQLNAAAAAAVRSVGVIGAGSSGLAVAKNLKQAGLPFECLEREDQLGGNWCFGKPHSSIYQSTHLISSKQLTEYTDFPMPEEYPEYPGHRQVLAYLQDYCRRFGLDEHIRYNSGVRSVERHADHGWRVTTESGETRCYSHLVIANGHNWDPRLPQLPGEFHGTVLHSSDYKTPDQLRDRRVLVVGGGNSGCDIAVESSRTAPSTCLSLRRGYHILPKFFHGTPIDVCGERGLWMRMPLWMRRLYAKGVLFLTQGSAQAVGFPKPDHKLFECHPVINSTVVDAARHGDLRVVPDVVELLPGGARFSDGSTGDFDLIVFATGFKISLPFIDRAELNWRDGAPRLYLNVFHPQRDDLFVAGLIQPDSGQFGLVDCQAKCIAAYLKGLHQGRASAAELQRVKQTETPNLSGGVRYVDSPRHAVEVEHHSYRRRLEKLYRRLSRP
ncbi:flavin-containing monooxygenase [Posidoniimonas corsicana]|uniref:flavin-containing monooxygenase n=1 Tax=Posidoniimonas corsicana TaxID=1938618 RepID=UPI0018D3CDAA|nr:NAD(P)-binding domain-containing protein [Posidoniimonas corsicana]